ncbi:MAG: TcpD family membrane protein [Lachnospiraceae bacterium]
MLAKWKETWNELCVSVNRKEGKIYRRILFVFSTVCFYMAQNNIALASNYGQTAGEYILDNLFWVGLVFMAIGLFSCFIKRAWVQAVITGVAGSVILYFMKNPDKLATIGESIAQLIFES